jgi:hypothetical protein
MLSHVSNPLAWPSNPVVALRLRKVVPTMEKECHGLESDLSAQLLLWVIIAGAFAALDTPEGIWFLDRADRLSSKIGLENYVELRDTIARFIRFETAQHESLRRLASRLAESDGNRVARRRPYFDIMLSPVEGYKKR